MSRYRVHLDYFMQTLTSLNLSHNDISDTGVNYLAQALEHNTVR